jgi:flagellar basal body rod protein FlgG
MSTPSQAHLIIYNCLANTSKTIAHKIDRFVSFKELLIDNISQKKYIKKAKKMSEYTNPILIDVNIP